MYCHFQCHVELCDRVVASACPDTPIPRLRSLSLLATGDAQAAVHIWSLATEYVSPKSHELTELNRLGNVQTDG